MSDTTNAEGGSPLFDPAGDLDDASERALLATARAAVEAAVLGEGGPPPTAPGAPLTDPAPDSVSKLGATFVTLRRDGELRGCIGSMTPVRSIVDDVANNARAATRDPRLPAVGPAELLDLDIKISVLTPLERLDVSSRADLLSVLEPCVDGLAIAAGRRRATFLPSVWEQLPDPDEFLDQLWRKAGLKQGKWPRDLVVEHYRTVEFG